MVPGQPSDERVLVLQDLKPMAAAEDGQGRDVTKEIAARDEVYADGYEKSPYQGVAKEWTFTFDLGEAPAAPLRLLMEGWIFPADASLNLAVAQRSDYPWLPPRLEVETADGWQVLMPNMGFPAGKTKAMVVDTPALPEGASRLRHRHQPVAALGPPGLVAAAAGSGKGKAARHQAAAEQSRPALPGLLRPGQKAPNAPHDYDYQNTSQESPWLPFPANTPATATCSNY